MNSETSERHGEWTIRPSPDQHDEYVLVCVSESKGTACGLDSGPVGDTSAFAEWARCHLLTHPGHQTYRLVADVQMVMAPKGGPLCGGDS